MESEASAIRLSVLIPAYNAGRYLPAAVWSVLTQRPGRVEVIVADDGSTDGTRALLDDWIGSGEIRYYRQENRGPASARNLALQNARGASIMFLDSDDLLVPGCLDAVLSYLDRNPEVGFLFANYEVFDDSGTVMSSGIDRWRVFRTIPHREVAPGEWVFSESLTRWIIRYGGFMSTSGLTMRRAAVDAAGLFLDGYCYAEDDEFYARVTYKATAGYIDAILSRRRKHAASLVHDPRLRLRNMRHALELAERQRAYYSQEPEMERDLRDRVARIAPEYTWMLIREGELGEAKSYLRRYLPKARMDRRWYKLLLRYLWTATVAHFGDHA